MSNAFSVKDRLKNLAVKNKKTFQELLSLYGVERTIYRLSLSKYSENFTLKGGIFLYALFSGEYARTTRDIDLLANNISHNVRNIEKIFENIFSTKSDDSLKFDLTSLSVKENINLQEYTGVNIAIISYLGKTKIPISIDIGFNDAVYPERVEMDFPVLLTDDFPKIYAYSIYSVIAEKFEAIVSLGEINSRYKDFYDIYILASKYNLNGSELLEAVKETFQNRKTLFNDIVAFEKEFQNDRRKKQWESFLKTKKAILKIGIEEVISVVTALLMPIVESIENDKEFLYEWDYAGKKWIENSQ